MTRLLGCGSQTWCGGHRRVDISSRACDRRLPTLTSFECLLIQIIPALKNQYILKIEYDMALPQ